MNSIIKVSLALFIAVLTIGCGEKKPSKTITKYGEISVVTPADFKEKSLGQTIIDIRTPREFAEGHIEGAININLFDKSFLSEMSNYDKSKPVFLYCRSGSRTASASKKVSNLGFEHVYDLQGGIINWARSNNQIIK